MKQLNTYINEAFRLRDDTKIRDKKLTPKYREELAEMIISRNNLMHGDFRDIDVSQLDDLGYIFRRTHFKTIDITGWETTKVRFMNSMFAQCKRLEKVIGLEDIDVSNVEEMQSMFTQCGKLKKVDLSNWKVKNVKYMNNMFEYCSDLQDVGDLSEWNLINIESLREMFAFCHNLENTGDLSEWTKRMHKMCNCAEIFYGCQKMSSQDKIPEWAKYVKVL